MTAVFVSRHSQSHTNDLGSGLSTFINGFISTVYIGSWLSTFINGFISTVYIHPCLTLLDVYIL